MKLIESLAGSLGVYAVTAELDDQIVGSVPALDPVLMTTAGLVDGFRPERSKRRATQ